jgi:hypothetical protein
MAVTFQLTLNDPYDPAYSSFYADLSYAASEWAQYLNSNATIRVQVDVGSFPNNLGFVIQNDANDFIAVGTNAQGDTVVEPWGEYALQTDSHVPGSPYDIHIYLNIATNSGDAQVFPNPNPADGGAVPANDYDATTMFLKALGYGLGFSAMSMTNAQPGWVTELDNYVVATPGSVTGSSLVIDEIGGYQLVGPVVEAVNGGPVPLVSLNENYNLTEAFEHIGNSPTISGSDDIMAVTQDIVGKSLHISRLDLAIMQEAGVPIIAGILPCFAKGTRIMTPRGAVAIERLRLGDCVLTLSGVAQKITWIGCRRVDCRRHPTPGHVMPIRVTPHAFGLGRPNRSVLLSPDHAVFIEDVLIPVKFLANQTTIVQCDIDAVTYYHIELARHDIVLAEGLPVETYLETGNRHAFENGGLGMQLFPDFQIRSWEALGCAPLVVTGIELLRARAKVELQAMLLTQMRAPGRRALVAA